VVVTRVAVVSDTHLPWRGRELPATLLRECAAADRILHAGDLVRHSVLAELQAYGPVDAVLGNCDEQALVGLLPERRVVDVEGVRIGMIHDSGLAPGRAARLARAFPDCAVVVFGHSHQPVIAEDAGLLLVNPGSATDRRRAPSCTMAVLDIADGRIEATLVPV
jgi:putative phosphoesterase